MTTRRERIACLSYANLCYVKVWWDLLGAQKPEAFFQPFPPSAVHYLAVMTNVFLLAALLWGVCHLARRNLPPSAVPFLRWAFLVILIVPLNSIREALQSKVPALGSYFWLHFGLAWRIGFTAVAAILLITLCLRWHKALASMAAVVLTWFFPFLVFACVEGAWAMAHPIEFQQISGPHGSAIGKPAARVVWIIFDEWDYRLTFPGRAPTVHLPQIDRLAGESLTGEMAFSPASRTLLAIPALLSGRFVTKAVTAGPSELLVTFAGEEKPTVWGTEPNILSAVAERGWNAAMAGWYLPYRRIFNEAGGKPEIETGGGFSVTGTDYGTVVFNQMRSLFEGRGRSPFGQSLMTLQHSRASQVLACESARLAADPRRHFVFLHLPTTHTPFYYDRRTRAFTLKNSPVSGYLDHLELADRTLAAIRAAMEHAGVWDKTTLLLSSDHWNRAADLLDGKIDHRVPFLLKLAGQAGHVSYRSAFNTVLSQALLLAVMDGEVTTPAGATAWLDAHRGGTGESAYDRN